ncbi:MAG: Smr/MutS family protein [Candidatus Pacebacteria bacterium]|nr:Smr/MutS family protein [Candidatus Paceibacterota bacterium]MCD8507915.1 Smr/MutS family protein [Candidatus Paceibacterota bacterium]MCD8528269.1 Smr/MutS family protein [Candidatus Paceibacterota bacterium]MCD8563958.1 Smr/MutS family protein [Candidatus Paceibacterota bacterium]
MNRYYREPDHIIDLHGCTREEARYMLDDVCFQYDFKTVRIITGKGNHNPEGVGILRSFVQQYLRGHNFSFRPARIEHGGDGAFEVTLRT